MEPVLTAESSCPFCSRATSGDHSQSSRFSIAFPDGFPLNPGHTLVVPRRHVEDPFDLNSEEQADLWRLVAQVKSVLQQDQKLDGFTVGVNVGTAAGQTVDHAHIHVIPRYRGDVIDPRGGVRWVIPARAAYWEPR